MKPRSGSRGGGGGLGGQDTPPPSFGGPQNFMKRGKTSHMCPGIHQVLILNSYPDPPPYPFQNPVSAPGNQTLNSFRFVKSNSFRGIPWAASLQLYFFYGVTFMQAIMEIFICKTFLHIYCPPTYAVLYKM